MTTLPARPTPEEREETRRLVAEAPDHIADAPPSTAMTRPVMYDEAAEASLASGYKFTPEHDRGRR